MNTIWPLLATAATVYLAWHFTQTIESSPGFWRMPIKAARRRKVLLILFVVAAAALIIRCIWWSL